MNLLVISRMFPSERHATSAIFFARFLTQLQPHLERLLVVSPRVYIPWVLSFRPRWAIHRKVTRHGHWQGIEVVRPAALFLKQRWYRPISGKIHARNVWPTVKRFHDQIGFDAVLGFCAFPDGASAVQLARWLKIPSLVWAVGSDLNQFPLESPRVHAAVKEVLESASAVVTASRALSERARRIAPNAQRIQPFYRGIDLTVFDGLKDRASLRKELGLPTDGQLLVSVGRMSVAKGLEDILAVFQRLKGRQPPVYLALAGEDLLGARLDRLIAGTGAADRVIRLGMVPHEAAAALLGAADVLVFASHHEGLPNVPLEAMAAGVPIVATQVGGVPEFITDGENGLLADVGDVDGIHAAVLRLLENEALRRQLVEAGRATVRERFDAERNAAAFADLLTDVIDRYSAEREQA